MCYLVVVAAVAPVVQLVDVEAVDPTDCSLVEELADMEAFVGIVVVALVPVDDSLADILLAVHIGLVVAVLYCYYYCYCCPSSYLLYFPMVFLDFCYFPFPQSFSLAHLLCKQIS